MEEAKLKDRKFCVYKHTSPSNKVYIGFLYKEEIFRKEQKL